MKKILLIIFIAVLFSIITINRVSALVVNSDKDPFKVDLQKGSPINKIDPLTGQIELNADNSLKTPSSKDVAIPKEGYNFLQNSGLESTAAKSGHLDNSTGGDGETDLMYTIGHVIRTVMSWLSVGCLLLLIYGGVLWMTASGNDDQIKKAKAILKNTIIGVVIIVSAYAVTTFIMDQLVKPVESPTLKTIQSKGGTIPNTTPNIIIPSK
ncbi:MAG: pilin [Planctomycetes bacterium]|jgi:hypothetical protein|nr:pilin [Planctomycetota bacterium]